MPPAAPTHARARRLLDIYTERIQYLSPADTPAPDQPALDARAPSGHYRNASGDIASLPARIRATHFADGDPVTMPNHVADADAQTYFQQGATFPAPTASPPAPPADFPSASEATGLTLSDPFAQTADPRLLQHAAGADWLRHYLTLHDWFITQFEVVSDTRYRRDTPPFNEQHHPTWEDAVGAAHGQPWEESPSSANPHVTAVYWPPQDNFRLHLSKRVLRLRLPDTILLPRPIETWDRHGVYPRRPGGGSVDAFPSLRDHKHGLWVNGDTGLLIPASTPHLTNYIYARIHQWAGEPGEEIEIELALLAAMDPEAALAIPMDTDKRRFSWTLTQRRLGFVGIDSVIRDLNPRFHRIDPDLTGWP